MKTYAARTHGPAVKVLCWFLAIWMALPAGVTAQLTLSPPLFPSSNTVRLVVSGGPVTNIRYDVYFTNALPGSPANWPLLGKFTNTVIFDLPLVDTNQGFFIVSSNHLATTNPPPKVATPVFSPPSASGNASVQVTVTCDTPGAVIYYTTSGATPTISDAYIASGTKVLIQCATTLKARAFRSEFIDSDVATGVYDVNCLPTVFAGNQQTTAGSTITLQGTASDDGLAQPLSNYWRQISGPADITFTNRNLLTNTVTLPLSGIYVVQLEAYDGFWTSTSRVTIARSPSVTIAMSAPSAGSTYTVPTNITLLASTNGSSVSVTQVQFFTGPQLIGTATNSGEANAKWTLEWRNVPAGTQSLYAVATSSSTTHLALASSPVSITVNYPTDIGRFTVVANDLIIPAPGLAISVNRTHDSRYGVGAHLGRNARLDYEQVRIEKTGSLATGYQGYGAYCFRKTTGNNTLVIISLSETEQYHFSPNIVFALGGNPSCVGESDPWNVGIRWVFTAASSRGGSLASIDGPNDFDNVGMTKGGGNCLLVNWNGANLTAGFHDEFGCLDSAYEPSWTDFTFTAPDGTKYKFDSDGKLSQKIDRNGNTLTFSSGSVAHNNGKQISFTRDGSSRITEIKDPIAIASSGPAAVKYSYDSVGRMTNVAKLVDRGGSGTYDNTGYRYEDSTLTNLITRVIDPRGVTVTSNLFDSFGRLSRQYDAIGNYTSYTYGDSGRQVVITNRNGKTSRRTLTQAGQLASVQDAEQAVRTYSYDSIGHLVAEITPIGATNRFAYNDRDDLIGTTNELSFTSTATYNSFGQPLVVVDTMGFGTTNGYDSKGNLIAVTNAIGIVTRYGYDAQGNRTAETNAFGLSEQTVTLNQFDQFGYLTNVTDALANRQWFTYDGNGNRLTESRERTLTSGTKQTLTKTSTFDAANRTIAFVEPDGFTNRTVFNGIGKVAFTTNKLGVVTSFDYDARGLLTNEVFAVGTAEQVGQQSSYDGEGRVTNVVDQAGHATRHTYDGVGRLRRTTFADDAYIENQYDAAGRVFAVDQGARSPGGIQFPILPLTTQFQYDAIGRRIAIVNPLNQTNRFAFDANGNQTSAVDGLNRTTSFTFDRLNRQTRITFSDTTSESYAYDGLNQRLWTTNQADVITRLNYDVLGRLTAATNGFGTGTSNWATYAYDEIGNKTNQVDALNRMTRMDYDAMGRRVRTVLPGSQSDGFAYDAVGNLTRHTNFNAVVITNQFDALNRLTNRTSSGGYVVRMTYNGTGHRKTLVDPSGSYNFSYDSRDRLLTNNGPAGTLVYSYDLFGRLASIQSTRAGGASVSYTYDSLNRLSNVVDAVAGTAIYSYDSVGNIQTLRLPNNVTNSYTHDPLKRLTNAVAKNSSGTIASFAYQLAAAGNRTNLSELVNGATRTFVWHYDSAYRLTNETITGTAPTGTIGYNYDAVGNRTNRSSSVSGISTVASSYNTNDWLTGDVYDNSGNTRTNGGTPYFYNVENRLTNFNNGAATYVYNADGIRVGKAVGTTNTLYLVDDQNPTGYAQVFEELTVISGATNLSRVYTYGHDLIAQRNAGTGIRNFYGYDGNGNVRYLTGTNASITDTYSYDAFGTLLASSGSTGNDYLFAGEQYDATLGLYYLRARYLNAGTGRFWTRDTFQGVRDDPSSLHKYIYCADNPVNCADPSGRQTLGGTLVTGGGIGVLAGIQLPAISAAQVATLAKIGVITVAIAATLSGDRSTNQSLNAMRLQLQQGLNVHYWSTTMTAPQNRGVTRNQVQLTLAAMFTAMQLKEGLDDDWDPFPFNRWETGLWSAIIRMSVQLNSFGPVSSVNTVMQEYCDPTDEASPRIDLENLRGTNLRQ